MNNNSTIVLLRPSKIGDPTEYTYQWAEDMVKLMRSYGYTVIDIQKNDVTYENVSKSIQYYNPRLVVTYSHGCPTSIQGQKECVITRSFDINELVNLPNFKQIIQPLIYQTGCINTCKTLPDICNPLCTNDTNVQLLKGAIVYTVACYSAAQLGKCAVKAGTDAYIGFQDLMLFPVDNIGSQDMFGEVHKVFLNELLIGHTVGEATQKTEQYEDELISFYKKTKYISLPLLWNKLNRRSLGNLDARIHN